MNRVTYSGTSPTLPVVFLFFFVVVYFVLFVVVAYYFPFIWLLLCILHTSIVFYHLLLHRLCISTLLACPQNWWACFDYILHGQHVCTCGIQSSFHLGYMPYSSPIFSLSISCILVLFFLLSTVFLWLFFFFRSLWLGSALIVFWYPSVLVLPFGFYFFLSVFLLLVVFSYLW